ncbi:MAG TPA: DUF4234 domain-containing protein [Pirellulaceae bacterium]|nr:DUF4234 domain-containing protein [Pirellulaceae bacterium]
MSHPAINPYQPPLAEPKLTAADAADVKRRDIAIFVLLNVITLGLYLFYVVYQWSKEINGLAGRVKYPPVVVLLVNILTCGLAGLVFECLFAFDVAEAARSRGIAGRMEQLGMWVIVANCAAAMTALIPLVGIPLAMALGILASALVQVDLNRLADAQSGKYR